MPEVSLPLWEEYIAQYPNAHILQTGAWGELKSAFGWKPVRLITGDLGAQVLFRSLPLGLSVGYLPKPINCHQWTSDSSQFWEELDAVCKKHRAIFLKIEPDLWEEETASISLDTVPGNQKSAHNIQPPRTIIVDLDGSEDDILARMKQKCRYNVRLAEKKGVTVRPWNDLQGFHAMMAITGGRDGFGVHSLEYYRTAYKLFSAAGMAELLVAAYQDKPLAALMVFLRGTRAWYLYGASNNEERNRMPAYLLQWEAMKWAKARGARQYDLWGIPDQDETTLEQNFENRSDGLWGVYRFKRGFGGQVKRALQARDRIYNRWLYQVYLWRYKNTEL